MIGMIWAESRDGFIGRAGGGLLWHIPDELKHFRRATERGALVMGRKTYESLPGELPGRPVVVASRSGLSLEEAIEQARSLRPIVWIAGGLEIYQQTIEMGLASFASVTEVDLHGFPGDLVKAPELSSDWSRLNAGPWKRDRATGIRFKPSLYLRN